jgi:hypothetical protein
MNKIYDCFTFYNEYDLLDIRLDLLYNHVDYFVIVEANQKFTNTPKTWNFDASRYLHYADKIIYIQVEDMPNSANPWDNEHHQRNAIMRGLEDAEDNDIIIISDCDEILRPEAVDRIRTSEQTLFALRMPLFNFKFNYMRTSAGAYDCWAMAARRSVFDDITPNTLREIRHSFSGAPLQFVNEGCELVEHAGWHFGYLGNIEFLKDKAQSFSHQEVNRPEFLAQIDIETSIAQRTDWGHNGVDRYAVVALDNYFPKSLTTYNKYILTESESQVLDILPAYPYNS